MARVKHAVSSRRRHKRMLKSAKGYWGKRSKLYRRAKETRRKAMAYAYRDRKARKRDFRRLWIARINAACRAAGVSYSRFMSGLRKSQVALDRKALAELALRDQAAFRQLIETSKEAVAA
ncbi:MAG: 50S ribosomal protein L20 [Candidatus Omnitrophica bacterium]|nr:50S ribosomal protein L20 [Candidatus Omnitrophota bacterium]